MSRWVDAEWLIKESMPLSFSVQKWVNEVQIMTAPSIDLVRCKECKKAHLTYDGDCKYCDEWKDDDGNYIEVYHDGNHYCSYGVRRESE